MSEPAKAVYIVKDGAVEYLCVIEADSTFHRFPISQLNRARLAAECASSLWSELTSGKHGAPADP